MNPITSYTTLKNNLIRVTEDDSIEFLQYIPTAIDLAEEKLFRELDIPDLDKEETGNLDVGSNTLIKPDNYKWSLSFGIVDPTEGYIPLERKTRDYIRDYWPLTSNTKRPKYYAEKDKDVFLLAPTPDDTYEFILDYVERPPSLVENTNETNYFTDNCPDILFYATMIEAVEFQKAWSQIQVWKQQYIEGAQSWNIQAAKQRRDNGQVPMNPEGGINTNKHTAQTNS